MKTSLTIVLVAAAMSVTATGYAKVFNDEQLNSLFQTDDTVSEISLEPSDILESAVQDKEIAIRLDLKINLVDVIDNKRFLGTAHDSNSTCENFLEECFEDTAFNVGRFLELKTVNDNVMFAGTNLWANIDLLLCVNELTDSCSLLLLTVAR
jgi:hypothetical protein